MTHRFAIGTQYLSRGKHPRLCTVSKQLTVTDETGAVIKRYYWSTHEFLGQTVTDHDVKDAAISIGKQMMEQSK
jgi:hypothetical protein